MFLNMCRATKHHPPRRAIRQDAIDVGVTNSGWQPIGAVAARIVAELGRGPDGQSRAGFMPNVIEPPRVATIADACAQIGMPLGNQPMGIITTSYTTGVRVQPTIRRASGRGAIPAPTAVLEIGKGARVLARVERR